MRESKMQTNCCLRHAPVSNQKYLQPREVQKVARIFEDHGAFLMTVISSKFSSQPDVDIEDLFQDLFLSLTENPIPQDVSSVKSYQFRSISNEITDHYRKAGKCRVCYRSLHFCRSLTHLCNKDNPAIVIENKYTVSHIRRMINQCLPEHEAVAVRQNKKKYEIVLSKSLYGPQKTATAMP